MTAYVIFPDGTRVIADVADTDRARARGLMGRAPLPDTRAMLFVFDRPGRYGFWMKNVTAPLDIIWLDASGRVVSVMEDAPPCVGNGCPSYWPEADAAYVVEVAGGFVRRHAVRRSDTVAITFPR